MATVVYDFENSDGLILGGDPTQFPYRTTSTAYQGTTSLFFDSVGGYYVRRASISANFSSGANVTFRCKGTHTGDGQFWIQLENNNASVQNINWDGDNSNNWVLNTFNVPSGNQTIVIVKISEWGDGGHWIDDFTLNGVILPFFNEVASGGAVIAGTSLTEVIYDVFNEVASGGAIINGLNETNYITEALGSGGTRLGGLGLLRDKIKFDKPTFNPPTCLTSDKVVIKGKFIKDGYVCGITLCQYHV